MITEQLRRWARERPDVVALQTFGEGDSLRLTYAQLWERIAALPGEVQAVGGPTIGADPIVGHLAALSWQKGRPLAAFLVRKETKSHGTRRLIENPPPSGARVVIFEDVVTSGGSTLDAVRAAEEAGLKVAAIFCLVDREQGGEKALSAYDYHPLFKKSEFGL